MKQSTLKEIFFLILGATFAIIGGALTSWLAFELQNNESLTQAEIDRQTVLAGFQAEVEVNLLKLKFQFDRYEKAIKNDSEPIIHLNYFSTPVYQSNLQQIGKIKDLGLITEIVAFYSGLTSFDNWAQSIREQNQNSENEKRKYISSYANFLNSGIYLQARMAKTSSNLPRVLADPNFSEDKIKLLKRIHKIRIKLGAKPSEASLRFHSVLDSQ